MKPKLIGAQLMPLNQFTSDDLFALGVAVDIARNTLKMKRQQGSKSWDSWAETIKEAYLDAKESEDVLNQLGI